MTENDYGGFVERTPLSTRLSVEPGTKKAPTAFERPRNKGITSGLANDKNLTHQPVVKHKRKSMKGKHFVEGVEVDSINDLEQEEFMEDPSIPGVDGFERHFAQLLYDNGYGDESEESNFF